jgi:RluA family pseudouridine synthase
MERFKVQVSRSLHNKRLDLALVEADLGLSRRKIRRIIDIGGSYINRKRVRIASRQVRQGDVIELEYDPQQFSRVKQEIQLSDADILYRNHGIIAINKPPGVPAQATRTQALFHVAALLERYLEQHGAGGKVRLTHRLDKETSGVMLLATQKDQVNSLGDQFRERKVGKEYFALAHGLCREKTFKVECNLGAINPSTGVVRVAKQGGKPSLTHVEVLEVFPDWNVTLFRCRPVTGRSHQIRVHLDHKGFPILGDKVYGRQKRFQLPDEWRQLLADHHMLHCRQMSFRAAEKEPAVTVTAPFPPNMQALLGKLGSEYGG